MRFFIAPTVVEEGGNVAPVARPAFKAAYAYNQERTECVIALPRLPDASDVQRFTTRAAELRQVAKVRMQNAAQFRAQAQTHRSELQRGNPQKDPGPVEQARAKAVEQEVRADFEDREAAQMSDLAVRTEQDLDRYRNWTPPSEWIALSEAEVRALGQRYSDWVDNLPSDFESFGLRRKSSEIGTPRAQAEARKLYRARLHQEMQAQYVARLNAERAGVTP